MVRSYRRSDEQRRDDKLRLSALKEKILVEIPGCGISADHPYREADLAIDFCEDVEPLPMESTSQQGHLDMK